MHGQLTVEFTHIHKVISKIDSCRHYNSSVSALWASSVQRSHEQIETIHKLLLSCSKAEQICIIQQTTVHLYSGEDEQSVSNVQRI